MESGALLSFNVASAVTPVSPRGSPPRLLLLRRGLGALTRGALPSGIGITGGKGSSVWSGIVVTLKCGQIQNDAGNKSHAFNAQNVITPSFHSFPLPQLNSLPCLMKSAPAQGSPTEGNMEWTLSWQRFRVM